MTVGDVRQATAEGRAMAEMRMLDEYAVMESLGMEYDPVLGEEVETYALLFMTIGRLKTIGAYGTDLEAGGRTVVEVVREFHIPADSPPVPAKAVVFVDSLDVSSDPTLTDARLLLDGPTPGSQTTARRMKITEVVT